MISRRSVTGSTFCCLFLFIFPKITNWQLAFHPDRYHGHHIHHGMFFEGWYYNMILSNNSKAIAIIPGVLINDNHRHSFLIIAYDNKSHYFHFPFESFHSSSIIDEFHVNISRKINNKNHINIFSAHEILIDVQPNKDDDDASESIQMNIKLFSNTKPKDLSWLIPGTMGPFSWVTIMQCYHHVLSMRHTIHGTIKFGENFQTNITGIGYLEKDWGQSFPSTWIWGQANQWINTLSTTASLFFSFAIVPVGFGFELPGFLVIFEYDNQFYYFNTYLLSIVENLIMNNNTNHLEFTVYDVFCEYKLNVRIKFDDANSGLLLYAPRHGRMEKFVREMLDSNAYFDVRLSKLIPIISNDDLIAKDIYQEYVLFEARSQHVAFEINGDIIGLTQKFSNMYGNTYLWCFSLIRTVIQYYRIILLIITIIFVILIVSKYAKNYRNLYI